MPTTARLPSGTSPRGNDPHSSAQPEKLHSPHAFSSDGRWLATIGGGFRVRDAGTGTEAAWPDHAIHYSSLAISPDSRVLALGSMLGQITLWNLFDGRLRQTLAGHQGWVRALAFSADGRSLASAGDDRTVRIWDVGGGSLVRVIRGHTEIVTGLAFSPAGDRMVTGSQDGTARVWDLNVDYRTGSTGTEPFPQFEAIEAIAYARGGRELRSFTRTGRVYRHAPGSLGGLGLVSTGLDVGWRTPLEPAAFDAVGRRVVAVDKRFLREAVCQDVDGGGRRTTLHGHTLAIAFATLSADGTRAATAAMSGAAERRTEVFVWDAVSGRLLHRREVSGEGIDRVALDPTGRRLAVSGFRITTASDGTKTPRDPFVVVFDVDTGHELLRPKVGDDRFPALGFSGDGRRLAAAGIARTVLIWDLEAGMAAVESRQGPPGIALDLEFSPDGRRLAVASRQQVKLMDTETAEELLTLRSRAQLVSNNYGFNPRVRFSPDGRDLAAACHDVSDVLAVWSSLQDAPANSPAHDRMARRRAVIRHLAFIGLDLRRPTDRRLALEHLEQVERIGMESADEFLARAAKLMDLDLWEQADADLDRAIALAPRDDEVLITAALICTVCGRFDRARSWYDRMSDPAASLPSAELDWRCAAFVLDGDLARYRRFCAEAVRRLELDQVGRWSAGALAYALTLGPDPGLGAGERLRIAERVYDGTSGADHPRLRMWALLALGAAQVRAGAPERAEPLFRDAIAKLPDGAYGATVAAWMAIATWQQGRRDEARSWSARADRFVSELRFRGHSGLEFRAPPGVWPPSDWWRLLIARREAHALIFDADFPAHPFAR